MQNLAGQWKTYVNLISILPSQIYLGVVHNSLPFSKRIKSTLFVYLLPLL